MSINDYWVAKINATEASGEGAEEVTPEEEISVEEAEALVAESVLAEEPAVEEEVVEDTSEADAAFEAEKAAATAKVPTSSSLKEEIRSYLIYEHGIDPEDLQDMTKDEMLSLIADLA